MEKTILYCDSTGGENTELVLAAAKKRAKELKIRDVVVATTHGGTAIRAKEVFADPKLNLVAVGIAEGYKENGWCFTEEEKRKLEKAGIKPLVATHALGDGVASSFTEKSGSKSIEEIVRDTLYRFGQGMKVCVEVTLMAADAGLIPMDREVMAIAGTSTGTDTCIVVKPAYPRKFFELEIREIVAKPRNLS
ncbi:MAG: hypothetical protein NTV61_07855 [Candidatus Bathyarchaeota archaeon]|nr:hypothetical protein [Candidatus Bathyarchaeota archaeon]